MALLCHRNLKTVSQEITMTVLSIFGDGEAAETEGDASTTEDGSFRVAAVAPRVAVPRPDILAAIDDTALRYGSHRGLRAAGLTVTEWRLLFRSNIEIESAYNGV